VAGAGRWKEIGVTCGRKSDGRSNVLEARGSLEVEASRIHKLRFKSKEIDVKNGIPDFKTSDPSSASVKRTRFLDQESTRLDSSVKKNVR